MRPSNMRPQQNTDILRIAAVLLLIGTFLLLCAVFGFFADQINDMFNDLAEQGNVGTSPDADVVLSFAFFFLVILANFLWLPSAFADPWILAILAGMFVLVAGYLILRVRNRGKRDNNPP